MRFHKNRSVPVFALCCFSCIILMIIFVFSDEKIGLEETIQEYADSINRGDIARYIKLFTSDNQEEMKDYLDSWGTEDFFREENVEIKELKRLSDRVGRRSAAVSDEEVSPYDDVAVYYTDMLVKARDTSDEYVKSGHHFRDFVFVKENGEWKILRISSPNLKVTVGAGEGFGTTGEQKELARKESLWQRPIGKAEL